MIQRYSDFAIENIWNLKNRYSIWLECLKASTKGYCESLQMNEAEISEVMKHLEDVKMSFEATREINRIESIRKHDTASFIQYVTTNTPSETHKYIYFGLTSSDIKDTAFSILIKKSLSRCSNLMEKLTLTLNDIALKHKTTSIMGRTHGVYGEPITFGIVCLRWMDVFKRRLEKIKIISDALPGMFSGSMGIYSHTSVEHETNALNILGLKQTLTSQIIPRDYYSDVIYELSVVASQIENVASQIRHYHRDEINEVKESFSNHQIGSSSMPHKKNPIYSENLCGLSRVVRSQVNLALENIIQWHERDMSHSSIERLIFPDTFHIICFSLERMINVLNNLKVNTDVMKERVENNLSVVSSQMIMNKSISNGYNRFDSYNESKNLANKSISETDYYHCIEEIYNKYSLKDEDGN